MRLVAQPDHQWLVAYVIITGNGGTLHQLVGNWSATGWQLVGSGLLSVDTDLAGFKPELTSTGYYQLRGNKFGSPVLKAGAVFITNNLSWLVIGFGALGYIFAGLSTSISGTTPYLLALMVAGSGFNLTLPQLVPTRNLLKLVGTMLLAQSILLPLLGYLLYRLLPTPSLALGLVALGVAPCEITSALLTMLAKGQLALATILMAGSIFLSVFLIPIWLNLFLAQSVPVDFGAMVVELGLVITLPFLVSSALRTSFKRLARYNDEFGGLSAIAVLLLILVVGGSLASFTLSWDLVILMSSCLAFNLGGYGLGWAVSRLLQQPPAERTALIFSSGMREFGIATTVALNFLPVGAALAPALYGLIMMSSASLLMKRWRIAQP